MTSLTLHKFLSAFWEAGNIVQHICILITFLFYSSSSANFLTVLSPSLPNLIKTVYHFDIPVVGEDVKCFNNFWLQELRACFYLLPSSESDLRSTIILTSLF